MDSKVSEKDMREVYFQAFGKEYDSADRKQAPLPLEIAYLTALNKLKREGKYAGGGEITDDAYYQSVNHFVYFCMNYQNDFLDAFGSLKTHLSNKFKDYYNKYGTYGVMIHFYTELDSENRRILTDYSLKNYKGTPISSDISDIEYFNSVNHFIYFCFNFPSNFMDAFSSHLKVHLSSKWTNAYEKKGSVGAMIYFWSELDGENRRKLATWSKNNYTGTKLYEVGGALGDVAGMLPSPLPMSTIQAMANGGQLELFADGGGVGEFPPKGELTNKDNFLLKYEKKGSDYEFFVYKPITKEVSGYNQIKHVCLNKDCPQKMTYEQFINYLYVELYLDDNKYSDGGGVDNFSKDEILIINQVLENYLSNAESSLSYYSNGASRYFNEQVRGSLPAYIESAKKKVSEIEDDIKYFNEHKELPYGYLDTEHQSKLFLTNLNELPKTNNGREIFKNEIYGDEYYEVYEKLYDRLDSYIDDKFDIKYSDGGGVDDDVLVGQVYLNTTNNSYIIIDKVEDSKEAYPSVYYHTYNQPQSYRNSNIDRISFFEDLVDSGVFVLQSDKMENGGGVEVSKSGSLEDNDHITYEISVNEINPHFYHKLIGTIEKYDENEYYATYINELYNDIEQEEETFSNFSDAEKWVLGKLNDEKEYYVENYSEYSNGGETEFPIYTYGEIDGKPFEVIGVNYKKGFVRVKNFSEKGIKEMTISEWIPLTFELGTPASFIMNGREVSGEVVMRNGEKAISLYRDDNYGGDSERISFFNQIDLKTLRPFIEQETFSLGGVLETYSDGGDLDDSKFREGVKVETTVFMSTEDIGGDEDIEAGTIGIVLSEPSDEEDLVLVEIKGNRHYLPQNVLEVVSEFANNNDDCINSILDMVNKVKPILDYGISDKKLIIVLKEQLTIDEIEFFNNNLKNIKGCSEVTDDEFTISYKENNKTLILNLKTDDFSIQKFKNGGAVDKFPQKGELTNKENLLLKYEKNGSKYEFYIYKPITKNVSAYEQKKYVCSNEDSPIKMSYNQFIRYLYAETYLDDLEYEN